MFWFVLLSFCKINALLRLLAGQAPTKYTDVYCMSGLSSRLCLCQELPSIVFLDKSSKAAGDHSKGCPNCACQSHLLHLFDSLMLVKWCQHVPASNILFVSSALRHWLYKRSIDINIYQWESRKHWIFSMGSSYQWSSFKVFGTGCDCSLSL